MTKNNLPTVHYLNTREYPTYEEYLEYCECNEIEPEDENSNDFLQWQYDSIELYTEDFFENLKYSSQNNMICVITGTLGLWNGRPDIDPVVCNSITEAVNKCISNMDDCDITLENGILYVNGYHHDGTNSFEIHKLSEYGINAYNDGDNITDDMFELWEGYLDE